MGFQPFRSMVRYKNKQLGLTTKALTPDMSLLSAADIHTSKCHNLIRGQCVHQSNLNKCKALLYCNSVIQSVWVFRVESIYLYYCQLMCKITRAPYDLYKCGWLGGWGDKWRFQHFLH